MELQLIETIAERAADRAVQNMLVTLGVDISDPLVAQQQFAALRKLAAQYEDEEHQEDMAFLRRVRTSVNTVTNTSLKTVAKTITLFLIGLLALGTKDWWLKHIGG